MLTEYNQESKDKTVCKIFLEYIKDLDNFKNNLERQKEFIGLRYSSFMILKDKLKVKTTNQDLMNNLIPNIPAFGKIEKKFKRGKIKEKNLKEKR